MKEAFQPLESYSAFVSAAMEFLASKTNANVLILVESEKGFEIFRNVPSPPWCIGIARAAQIQFEESILEMSRLTVERRTQIEQDEEDRIDKSAKRDKEKAN